jgi:signal transduction histidine kinase
LNRKLLIALFLIVALPLVLLLWMGQRVARTEEERLDQRFDVLMKDRLILVDQRIQDYLRRLERDFLSLTSNLPLEAEALRTITRSDSRLASVFRISASGEIEYPVISPDRPLTLDEKGFLHRTGLIWQDRELVNEVVSESESSSRQATSFSLRSKSSEAEADASGTHGWYAWHFEHGLHLLFWRQLETGAFVGAELNRARLMSDLIAALPDSGEGIEAEEGRIVLSSADGDTLYQWGMGAMEEATPPRVSLPASPPLESWRWSWYGEPALGSMPIDSATLGLYGGIAALALALGLLAVYFYRESSRELREAGQRVNFVGQVSHELKTPLTNIRMYAELLEQELDDRDTEARKDLNVIVSESRRLSRLIGNILTFSRKDRETLRLRLSKGNLDEALRDTVEHFRPLLESKGVAIELVLQAGEEASFDRDVVEQIVGNLLSNVEKYGASGGHLKVESRREGDRSTVTVSDRGPGVPKAERERIFEPFYRVSDKLTDGVAGTGLGLALARDLARLHGGDLRLMESSSGACFELTIRHASMPEGGVS